MRIITIGNQKGGVGKTTTTMNLGVALKKLGNKVLLIDFDPQSSLSIYLNHDVADRNTIDNLIYKFLFNELKDISKYIKISKNDEIEYIASNPALANIEKNMETRLAREYILKEILENEYFEKYDYILIDTSPSISILMTNAFTVSTDVIIPVQSQFFTIESLRLVYNTISQVKKYLNKDINILGILCTMVENTVMTRVVTEHLEKEYSKDLLKTKISKSVMASESTAIKKSLVNINCKLGEQYLELGKEIMEK
ncbi:MAG: ParA family protein [Parvimonas sp.]|uniref:ParA family protein n=1 Tax=Parvimonas sp. TaxID=1944660 RepID=UPI0025F32474|nr:ParA family protein [Parvimonas sp.]MCI5997038.1 ParA family protein [Parvimonas sp.]